VSATTTDRPDVAAYLAAVRSELADLRADERDDLLAEVEASLLDAAEESDAPIAARLGPPADFAAELRSAAGLTTPTTTPRPRRSRLVDAWRSPRAKSARRVLVELAPLWWVARACVVVAVLAWLLGASWSVSMPIVPRIGGAGLGLVVLLLAIVGSVALGLRERTGTGRAGRVGVALNVLLALAAVPAVVGLIDRVSEGPPTVYAFVETPTRIPGLALDGAPIENVYPYSREGRLLLDVLLFDQQGRPINVRPASNDPERRVLRSNTGADLYNSFPIRYFESGTTSVAHPGASPAVRWSPIVTPQLQRKPER